MERNELEHLLHLAEMAHDAQLKAKSAYEAFIHAATSAYVVSAQKAIKNVFDSSLSADNFRQELGEHLKHLFEFDTKENPHSSDKPPENPFTTKSIDELFTKEEGDNF